MTLDANRANRQELTIGVVGAGAMGRGIAQVAAVGGCVVKLYDTRAETAAEAVSFIGSILDRAADKGRMTDADAKAALARIEVIDSLDGFAPCDAVIEAVIEDLDLKHQVFRALEGIVGDDTVLATNTSSISVTAIAAACERPARVAGFHFFNPVPLMKLVEVIDGIHTAPLVADFLVGLGKRMGREPVRVADAPGFLVNQVGRGFNIESAHIAADGIASFADFDRVLRDAAGFRMGPFELMDLTALDVTHPATELIYRQFYEEPRFRPSVLMANREQAGLLGRKTNQGFYAYIDGKAQVPDEAPTPAYDGRPVWISRAEPEAAEKLRAIVTAEEGALDEGDRPADQSLILTTPLGDDATTAAVEQGLDASRTVAVDTVFGLETRRTVMRTPITLAAFADSALGLFASGEATATLINDSPGFIAQRVVSMIVNIGCAVAQAGTAAPDDIDKAVTLGLGYPHGPLAFGDLIGPATVLRILTAIHRLTGDPRYRPTPWLRRRAQLGVSLLTPEN